MSDLVSWIESRSTSNFWGSIHASALASHSARQVFDSNSTVDASNSTHTVTSASWWSVHGEEFVSRSAVSHLDWIGVSVKASWDAENSREDASRAAWGSASQYPFASKSALSFLSANYPSLSKVASTSTVDAASVSTVRYPSASHAASKTASESADRARDAASISGSHHIWFSDLVASASNEYVEWRESRSVHAASADAAASAEYHDWWVSDSAHESAINALSGEDKVSHVNAESKSWVHEASRIISRAVSTSVASASAWVSDSNHTVEAVSVSNSARHSESVSYVSNLMSWASHKYAADSSAVTFTATSNSNKTYKQVSHKAFISASDVNDPCGYAAQAECEKKKKPDGSNCQFFDMIGIDGLPVDCLCDCGEASADAESKMNASNTAYQSTSYYAVLSDLAHRGHTSFVSHVQYKDASRSAKAFSREQNARSNSDHWRSWEAASDLASAAAQGELAESKHKYNVSFTSNSNYASASNQPKNPCIGYPCGCGGCSVTVGGWPACDCEVAACPQSYKDEDGFTIKIIYDGNCGIAGESYTDEWAPPDQPDPGNYDPTGALDGIG